VHGHGDGAFFAERSEKPFHLRQAVAGDRNMEIIATRKGIPGIVSDAISTTGPLFNSACKIRSGVLFAIAATSGGPDENAVKFGSPCRHFP